MGLATVITTWHGRLLSGQPPPSHTEGMTAPDIWSIAPPFAILLGLIALAYAMGWWQARSGPDGRSRWPMARALAFYAGLLALAAAFGGPVEAYSDDALAMHMVQHLIFLQLAPPLLWMGRPGALMRRTLPGLLAGPRPALRLRRLAAPFRSPWLVGLVFNLNLLLWHLPPAYDAALRSEALHSAEHLGFLLSAMAFWWLVLEHGRPDGGRTSHAAYGLCFASCMAGMLVALALSFAPEPLYPWYRAQDANPFGMSTLTDQRLGGAIMFLGGLGYLAILIRLLAGEAAGLGQEPASPASDGGSERR